MKNYSIHGIMSNKEIQKQFIKYLIVGGSSAALELLLFTFLRKAAGLSITTSNVTAAVTSTAFNFLVNRGWSFKAASSFTRSLVLYLILFFLNTAFSTYAIAFMVSIGVFDVLAKLITMGMITMWNFVLYRRVIFK